MPVRFIFRYSNKFQYLSIIQNRKRYKRFRHLWMFADHFLHPDHVIPFIELVATLLKCSHKFIPQMFMKMHAVVGQMFILLFRISNTGIEITDMLFLENLLECLVLKFSSAAAFLVFINFFRRFHSPIISLSLMEN